MPRLTYLRVNNLVLQFPLSTCTLRVVIGEVLLLRLSMNVQNEATHQPPHSLYTEEPHLQATCLFFPMAKYDHRTNNLLRKPHLHETQLASPKSQPPKNTPKYPLPPTFFTPEVGKADFSSPQNSHYHYIKNSDKQIPVQLSEINFTRGAKAPNQD